MWCEYKRQDSLMPWHISIVRKMRMIAFTIFSFAIMSFAMADSLPQGKVLISTIHSFDIHYRQKLGIICIVCYDLTDDLSFFEKKCQIAVLVKYILQFGEFFFFVFFFGLLKVYMY